MIRSTASKLATGAARRVPRLPGPVTEAGAEITKESLHARFRSNDPKVQKQFAGSIKAAKWVGGFATSALVVKSGYDSFISGSETLANGKISRSETVANGKLSREETLANGNANRNEVLLNGEAHRQFLKAFSDARFQSSENQKNGQAEKDVKEVRDI